MMDIGASPKVCCCASSVLSREVNDISGMDGKCLIYYSQIIDFIYSA